MKKLYVGNLPYNMTRDDLNDLFQSYGNLEEVYLVKDRRTRRLKGYAFVAYTTEEEAKAALEMDGYEYQGRTLKVSLAKGTPNTASSHVRGSQQTKTVAKRSIGIGGVILVVIISALTSYGVSQYSTQQQVHALNENIHQLRVDTQKLQQQILASDRLAVRGQHTHAISQ